MGALEDSPKFQRGKSTPEEITHARREVERLTGRKLPPGPDEIAAYESAGLEPPID